MTLDRRFETAAGEITRINEADPVMVYDRARPDAPSRPKAAVHAERVLHWLEHLDPEADALRKLAALGHHIGRWELPRTDYPDGRAGYLRWRTEQKRRQAARIAQVLTDSGYDGPDVERVVAIVAKQGLGQDPDVQAHEDALCLVFLEQQLDELADRLNDDRTVEVLRKSIKKMSPDGLAAATQIRLSERGRTLLERATEQPS